MTSADSVDSNRSAQPGGVSRRTIVKGAAWAVPVIAIAAPVPSVAASPCTPTTSIDSLSPGTRPTSVLFPPSSVSAAISWASGGQGGDSTPGDTGRVEATSTSPSWNYIEMEMLSKLDAGDYVQLTLTLSQSVTGFSLLLHDIDSVQGQWQDTVVVDTPGYTLQLGSGLQGAGTVADPIKPNTWGDYPISSGQGTVRITWPGTVSTVTLRYIAGINGNSANQHIGLGDMRFSACPEPTRAKSSARSIAPDETRDEVLVGTGDLLFVESDGSQDL